MISLIEELYLLALDEEKGNIVPFTKKTLAYGLSGAILAELSLQKKVCSNDKHRLEVNGEADPLGDDVLDEALKEIRASDKPRKMSYWVSQFSSRPKRLQEHLGENLSAKDVLYQEDKHFFRKQPAPESGQPAVPSKFESKKALRGMILSTEAADARGLALLQVAQASDLLGLIFTQDELPLAKNRIHEKIIHAALEDTDMQCIEEIGEAVKVSLEDDLD